MTSPPDFFAEYPKTLRGRTLEPSVVYELATDRYAVHKAETRSAVDREGDLGDDSAVRVVMGQPSGDEVSGGGLGPVYRLKPAGTVAVPTGLIFIRFKPGVNAADRSADIRRSGYEVVETVEYAPQSAWLSVPSGDIAKALGGIVALERLADMENVEPQMLMPRAAR